MADNPFGIGEIPDMPSDDDDVAAVSDSEMPGSIVAENGTNVSETETSTDAAPTAPTDSPERLEPDGDTQSVLQSKFGGDVAKLERSYDEAQRLIGRQGNDLGEARREVQQLREDLAELRGLVEGRGRGGDEDADPGDGDLFGGYDREELLRAFAHDPAQFLQGAVEALVDRRVGRQVSQLEEQQKLTAEQQEQLAAEQRAYDHIAAWFNADETRKPLNEEMNRILAEDAELWSPALMSGDSEKVHSALEKMAMLAKSRLNGSGQRAPVNKAAGRTTPPSGGQSGANRTQSKKRSDTQKVIDDILAAAKPASVFG